MVAFEYGGQGSLHLQDVDSLYSPSEVDGAVVMIDISNRDTLEDLSKIMFEVEAACREDIPIVFAGNKTDKGTDIIASDFDGQRARRLIWVKKNCPFLRLSVKSGCNMGEPFLHILKKVTGNNELVLVDPPECVMTCELERKVGWAGYDNLFS